MRGAGLGIRMRVPGRAWTVAAGVLALVTLSGCERTPGPRPGTQEYADVVSAFYAGVAAIQVGEDDRAQKALTKVVDLAPDEPAAPADLAILAYEQHRFDSAATWVERARSGAPHDGRILLMAGLVARERGRLDDAIADLRAAASDSSAAARARFLLSELLEQRAGVGDVAASRLLLDSLLATDGSNLFLRLTAARQSARHGDARAMDQDISKLDLDAAEWPDAARKQLVRVVASVGDPQRTGEQLTYLATTLEEMPDYRRERDSLTISTQRPDLVVTRFLRLAVPSETPAPPDLDLRFTAHDVDAPAGTWREALPVWPGGKGAARTGVLGVGVFVVAADSLPAERLTVPTSRAAPDAPDAAAELDFDHDFRMDLALAGSGGLRLLRQDSAGRYVPVPASALPADVRTRALTNAWAVDADVDGDVDLVLAPAGGAPFVLRNQGDGTFSDDRIFGDQVTDARQLLWGDLDNDGDPDAVILDAAGRVHAFANPRHDRPEFVPWKLPDDLGPAAAIALGDLNGDGTFDVVVLRRDGQLLRAWKTPDGWRTQDLARWSLGPDSSNAHLLLADLDNNGALDVVASAGGRTQIWLADSTFTLVRQDSLPFTVTAAADPTGAGRIVLFGVDRRGRPVRLTSYQSKEYYALTLSPRATRRAGDGRINTFGIGGQAEVRAGMLYAKRLMTAPFVHFGIGANTGVTVARIIWPNGTAQADFDLLASQGAPIIATQRLKGSCPWLFAWDGKEMKFVTDAIWRTALGLRINTYGSSAVIHSEDWMKIRGDQLEPRNGAYDLRITAELWESHFFDHLELMTVDHPAGTQVWVNESFIIPPPPLRIQATGPLHAVVSARDDQGHDMTERVRSLDRKYVDTFGLTHWQGVAKEHWLQVDLGPDVPAGAHLLLIAQGWVYPTDGSINVAYGQGHHPPLHGIRVQVPDGRGGWRVLHQDVGMPSGKTKTMVVDLKGAFGRHTPKLVRLDTNMEIYFDRIGWAVARPDVKVRVARIPADYANLHFRGFSVSHQAGRRAPDLPVGYQVATTVQRWQDLEGYYTRYGDVLPLVAKSDDRYVIMDAGDELSLRFAAQPAPPAGWVRDYVLDADGWVKDGDLNDGWSKTLRPLPYHGMTSYSQAPGPLEDDPAYLLHPGDWLKYQTRYVTPRRFHEALTPN